MSLAIPGLSSSTAIVSTSAAVGASGRSKLDPRFQAILNQAKVKPEHQDKLGDADIETAQEFGHIAKNDDSFFLFLKRVCNLDPDARGEDALPVARLTIAWETARRGTRSRRSRTPRGWSRTFPRRYRQPITSP